MVVCLPGFSCQLSLGNSQCHDQFGNKVENPHPTKVGEAGEETHGHGADETHIETNTSTQIYS